MVPYQKEKAHEDEDGHCGHGHRVWDQAGDVVVQWVQGFQDHLFKEVLLCFREREREREKEERGRGCQSSDVFSLLGTSHPFVVPTSEQISSGCGFITRVTAWSACQDKPHHKSKET